jgi:hypothetical protein
MPIVIRSLNEIASEIDSDWTKVSVYARPYLDAMHTLISVNDSYGADSARSVVLYFLSNASTWRGPVAREVKAELKALTKPSTKHPAIKSIRWEPA